MADQEYCLRWNNHQTTLTGIFDKLLQASRYTDCTISAGGQNVAAHKVLLTACSPYFDSLFSGIRDDRHAVIVLSDVSYAELRALMDYMYRGEVNISQDRLGALLKVAEALQIRGLYEVGETQPRAPPPPVPAPAPVAVGNRSSSGLTIERTRRSAPPSATMDFPLEASRDDSTSPVPKRRKRPARRSSVEDFAPLLGDPLIDALDNAQPATLNVSALKPVVGDVPALDNILPDQTAILPDPPKLEREPHFEALQPKEEFIDEHDDSIENITLDDDDDDMDESQQPGTSHMGEGSSSQGYPPSWHNSEQSNDEVFMAAQQAVGDGVGGVQREGKSWTTNSELFYCRGKLLEKPYQCPNCPKRYAQDSSLNTHLKLECGKEPTFQCQHCVYRCKHKASLQSHVNRKHPETQ